MYHLHVDLRHKFRQEDSVTDIRSPVCTRVLQSYRFVYFKGISGACSFSSLSLSLQVTGKPGKRLVHTGCVSLMIDRLKE